MNVVQSAIHGNGGITSDANCTWPGATVAGNMLILAVAVTDSPAGTYTVPTGWSFLSADDNTLNLATTFFYIDSSVSASRSGNESVPYSNNVNTIAVLMEIGGIFVASGNEGGLHSNADRNTGTAAGTGSVVMGNQNSAMIGITAYFDGVSGFTNQSSATNGFTIDQQLQMAVGLGFLDFAILHKFVTAPGTYSTGTSTNKSIPWDGQIQGFIGLNTDTGRRRAMASMVG